MSNKGKLEMKIITVASIKGGVGKTTISLFLSQSLGNLGKKVLFVDLDPNNNATDYLLHETNTEIIEKANSYHVLTKRSTISNCIHTGLFVDCLPSTLLLNLANQELSQNLGLVLRFKKELQKLDYDYAVIDTPPSLDNLFRTGLYSSDLVLAPIANSRWTFQSLGLLLDEIETIKENTDRNPELMAVPSMVTNKEADSLFEQFSTKINMSKAPILKMASLKNSIESRKQIKAESKASLQFDELVKVLL